MTYVFKTLKVEEQEEMLVNTLKAQELDLYLFTLNKERYEDMLPNLPDTVTINGQVFPNEFKLKIASEINVLNSRLNDVTHTITAVEKQIPVDIDYPAVLLRLETKQAAYIGTKTVTPTEVVVK